MPSPERAAGWASRSRRRRTANASYLAIARAIAHLLIRDPLVESVYARRGLAFGEVLFGRSDIDLTLVVRRLEPPALEAEATWRLARTVGRLRRVLPLLGQCELATREELASWADLESYRGSIEARSLLMLAGPELRLEQRPVRPRDALLRALFWLETYLPMAASRHNTRNLRKIALEIWAATLAARGEIPQPLVTKGEMLAAYRAQPPEGLPPEPPGDETGALRLCLELMARLRSGPPLERLATPLVFPARFPPSFDRRTFVVLPEPASPLPAEARTGDLFVCTPEVLDAYVSNVDAFAHWALPEELLALGIRQPNREAFLHSAAFFGHPWRMRAAGFSYPPASICCRQPTVELVLARLDRGEAPARPSDEELARILALRTDSVRKYYLSLFPGFYAASRWRFLG
jgi:predicted nucleotidyltransferase